MFFIGKIQKEMNARCDDGDCVCQAPKISIKAQKDKDKSIKDRAAHWLSENSSDKQQYFDLDVPTFCNLRMFY